MKHNQIILFFGLLLLGLILPVNSFAKVEKFQSAYLYNISRYMEWPTDYNENEFIIGVMGSHAAIIPELQVVSQTKRILGKKIVIQTYSSPQEISNCNILFIPENQNRFLPQIIKKTENSPILLVTEKSGMLKKGANLNFVFTNNKLQFEIEMDRIRKKGLKVHSKLQTLAMN
ncbi:YfiR family protein [Marinilabilia sp.]